MTIREKLKKIKIKKAPDHEDPGQEEGVFQLTRF
jgi:hypothetical protein